MEDESPKAGRPATAEEVAAAVARAEAIFGADPNLAPRLRGLARLHTLGWVVRALEECERKAARGSEVRWAYLVKILNTWRDEGGPKPKAARPVAEMSPEDLIAEARRLAADCPDCERSGLASRRLVVSIGGGPERQADVTFPCLCPLGRAIAAAIRRDHPRGLDLADWHSLWLAVEPIPGHWPALPPPGSRRSLISFRLRSGAECRIVRCLDDVLLPKPAPTIDPRPEGPPRDQRPQPAY